MLCDGGRNAVGLRSKHSRCYWRLCLVALRQIYSHVGCQIWLRCLIDITGGSQNVTRHLETALPAMYSLLPGTRATVATRNPLRCRKGNRVYLGFNLHSQLECGAKERVLQQFTPEVSPPTAKAPQLLRRRKHSKWPCTSRLLRWRMLGFLGFLLALALLLLFLFQLLLLLRMLLLLLCLLLMRLLHPLFLRLICLSFRGLGALLFLLLLQSLALLFLLCAQLLLLLLCFLSKLGLEVCGGVVWAAGGLSSG
jgi:hypothetical protein